jgi:ABC-type sulfate transport system permease component
MGERRTLVVVAIALAALAALPVVAVVARGIAPGAGATWAHLADTVLARYVGNTLALVALVGVGVAFGGTLTGWAIAQFRFRGSAFFEWALLLPLAMPAYVMAYAYTDLLQYAGPVQTALRETFGWSKADYWFPDVRSLSGAATMFVFTLYPYVYLLARTAFVDRPAAFVEAARTLGLRRREAFWRVELPLARPAIAGGIALALMETLADFGTVAYFAVDTVHDRDLPRVVHARRPRGLRAARRDAARVRARRGRGRARVARRRAQRRVGAHCAMRPIRGRGSAAHAAPRSRRFAPCPWSWASRSPSSCCFGWSPASRRSRCRRASRLGVEQPARRGDRVGRRGDLRDARRLRAAPRARAGCRASRRGSSRSATPCRAPCSPSACCCRSARSTAGSPTSCARRPATARAPAHRHDRRAGLRVPGALLRRRVERHRARLRAHHARRWTPRRAASAPAWPRRSGACTRRCSGAAPRSRCSWCSST